MKFILLFLPLVLVLGDPTTDLWDQWLKQDKVITSVEHYGRQLHIWKEEKGSYNRFYVTPLVELINNSIRCLQDKYADEERYMYRFSIRLWDQKIALKVKSALQQLEFDALTSNILPIPMQMVRLDMDKEVTKRINAHNSWRSNQNQPSTLTFELFMKDSFLCQSIVNDSIKEPGEFLAKFKLALEFTIISGQTESRSLNITGSMLGKSDFFASLSNEVNKNGEIYLTSTDSNNLAKDIYRRAVAQDIVTSDYIPSEQEDKIIQDLMGVISDQQIQSSRLNDLEWDSVFWDDIFTRPDIQTKYLNEAFKFNESFNHFQFDSLNEEKFHGQVSEQYANKISKSSSGGGTFGIGSFSLGANRSKGETREDSGQKSNDTLTHDINTLSKDEMVKTLEQNHINSRWNGQKFEQKPINLHRVNTQKLSSQAEIYYQRVVVTKLATTSKLEILPESAIADYYQDFLNLSRSEDLFNQRLAKLESFYESLSQKLEGNIGENTQKLEEFRVNIENTQNNLLNIQTHHENVRNDLQNQINNHVGNLQNQINDHVGNLQNQINDHVGNLQNQINEHVGNLQNQINEHAGNLQNQINELQN